MRLPPQCPVHLAAVPSRGWLRSSESARIGALACAVLVLSGLAPSALAQSDAPEPTGGAIPAEVVEELDRRLVGLRADEIELAGVEAQLGKGDAKGDAERARVLEHRRERSELRLFEDSAEWLGLVAAQHADGRDVSAYRAEATARLASLPAAIRKAHNPLVARTISSYDDAKAADQAASDLKVKTAIELEARLVQAGIQALAAADGLGVGGDEERLRVRADLQERAETMSAVLELATEDAAAQQARLALLPDDAEVKASLAVAQNRVDMYVGALEATTKMMAVLELDTDPYDRQLLTVTGNVSTDVLDVDVVGGMISEWVSSTRDAVSENAPSAVLRIAIFVVIVLVSLRLGRIAQRLLEKALSSGRVRHSQLLRRMLLSGIRNLIVTVGILIGLAQLGFSLGPVLAGLGIAGFVLGFALQDSLANFASGLMILLYRPLDVGDLVEAGGVFGTVSHMSLVNTTILTLDNQTLIVPNNLIWTQVIKNVTAQDKRRVDMVFGISYGDDIPKAERVLMEVLESNEMVLKDPEPNVRVHELGDSSVNFVVRPWCATDDYWDVFWDVTKAIKMRLDEESISIPFPQRDVHFYPAAAPPPASPGDETVRQPQQGAEAALKRAEEE
jgi:small conductance mechanosensitive channel